VRRAAVLAVSGTTWGEHVFLTWTAVTPTTARVRYARAVDGDRSFAPPATVAVDAGPPPAGDIPRA
jgi:hypothetical protein